MAGPYSIEFFEDDHGASPVEKWLDGLGAVDLAAILSGLEHVLSHRGVGVCATEWGKQLGDGLFEFRIRHSAAEITRMFGGAAEPGPKEKVLLRVFCHAYGNKIVVLLHGYDKARDPSGKKQEKEIEVARRRLVAFKQRQQAMRKGLRRGRRP